MRATTKLPPNHWMTAREKECDLALPSTHKEPQKIEKLLCNDALCAAASTTRPKRAAFVFMSFTECGTKGWGHPLSTHKRRIQAPG